MNFNPWRAAWWLVAVASVALCVVTLGAINLDPWLDRINRKIYWYPFGGEKE